MAGGILLTLAGRGMFILISGRTGRGYCWEHILVEEANNVPRWTIIGDNNQLSSSRVSFADAKLGCSLPDYLSEMICWAKEAK